MDSEEAAWAEEGVHWIRTHDSSPFELHQTQSLSPTEELLLDGTDNWR